MMKKVLLSILLCCTGIMMYGQSACEKTYNNAKSLYTRGEYEQAIKKFEAVKNNCDSYKEAADVWIKLCDSQKNLEDVTSQKVSIENKYNRLNDEYQKLKTANESLNNKVNDNALIQKKADQADTLIAIINKRNDTINSLKSSITSLKTCIDNQKEEIDSLKNTLNAINDSLDKLNPNSRHKVKVPAEKLTRIQDMTRIDNENDVDKKKSKTETDNTTDTKSGTETKKE